MKMLVLLNYIQAIVVNIDYIIGYYLLFIIYYLLFIIYYLLFIQHYSRYVVIA